MNRTHAITILAFLLCTSINTIAQEPLTNKDIISMHQGGISTEIIIAKIKASRGEFDTSVPALQELKKAGVPDDVVMAILNLPKTDKSGGAPPSPLVFPPKGDYRHDKKIESSYDKFKDQTTVSLKYLSPLPAVHPVTLNIIATFVYSGTTVKQPAAVGLWFQSHSTDWQFLQYRQLFIVADGERMDLGEAYRVDSKINSSTFGRHSNVSVSEMLGVRIPTDVFLRVAKARSVEMKLGRVEFRLADDHLEALRDFASRMLP